MIRRNQNNDYKNSRKILKLLEAPKILDLSDDKCPEFDQFSLQTNSSSNITECSRNSSESGATSHNMISNSYMKLRSKCRCTINPFDLSSDCGDDDFLDNKYSLNYKARHSTPKLSPMNTTCNDIVSSSFDLDSIGWSEIDQFSSSDVTNLYDYISIGDSDKKSQEFVDRIQLKKRSSDENTHINDINRKRPRLTFSYEFRQRHFRGDQKLLNRPSPLPIMRDSSSNHVYIPEISNQTITDMLIGRYSCYLSEFVIIDCRFPYEYDGGHITNSINIFTCHQLMQYLIGAALVDMDQELQHTLKLLDLGSSVVNFDNKAFIFYCEFSSFRGPKLAQCLRGLDRLANTPFHPRLKIPNIYILHGGYMELFSKYPQLCHPVGYVSMKQTRYALRSPNNPNNLLGSPSPTKYSGSPTADTECGRLLLESMHTITEESRTNTVYRKQQINCQRQLRSDAKRLSDIVASTTKNSDIIRLFKFDEIF